MKLANIILRIVRTAGTLDVLNDDTGTLHGDSHSVDPSFVVGASDAASNYNNSLTLPRKSSMSVVGQDETSASGTVLQKLLHSHSLWPGRCWNSRSR